MEDALDHIIITQCPINTDPKLVFNMAQDDEVLIGSIIYYGKELEAKGVEIFERKHNIIATNEGFYCAFWAKDLVKKEDAGL